MAALTADLARTERAISELIASDAEPARLFGLVTSVEGVGPVTAAQLLVSTNEFRNITEPKKFACYAGVVPFTRESGVYRGRARVSKMANMKVKTLLHMSALSAISCNGDLKEYYRRKVEQDKKNKMSVINAVRNKIVLRIFACVNQNRKYDKTYRNALA